MNKIMEVHHSDTAQITTDLTQPPMLIPPLTDLSVLAETLLKPNEERRKNSSACVHELGIFSTRETTRPTHTHYPLPLKKDRPWPWPCQTLYCYVSIINARRLSVYIHFLQLFLIQYSTIFLFRYVRAAYDVPAFFSTFSLFPFLFLFHLHSPHLRDILFFPG